MESSADENAREAALSDAMVEWVATLRLFVRVKGFDATDVPGCNDVPLAEMRCEGHELCAKKKAASKNEKRSNEERWLVGNIP
mmetsp:Transcript_39692/g.105756  ORF Transcript_39692/g.105756 Transcript_39692/m.105756 type:complete len:83 (-) Transcript_39692:713-961(-)